MKPILVRTIVGAALASPLLLAVSAAAPGPMPSPGPSLSTSPAMVALQALLRELSHPEDRLLPATARMEKLAAQAPSPATADKLRAAFGTDRLVTIERQPAVPGHVDWRVTIPALRYAPPQGAAFDWTEGRFDVRMDPAGTTAVTRGAWPSLAAEGATLRMALRGFALDSDQHRGGGGLWYGTTRIDIAGLDVQPKGAGQALAATGLHTEIRFTEQPKTADVAYDNRIDRIAVGGEQIDAVHVGLRFSHIDKAALAELADLGAARGAQTDPATPSTPAQRAAAAKPLLRSFAKAALAPGAALDIDDISARYHGEKVALKGRVTLDGATPADLDTAGALFKKIVARFELRVPIALVREVAGTIVAQQSAQQGTPADPDTLARLGQSATDVVVGKLTGGGYARVEDEVLVSTIEWRAGALRANGKPVALGMPPGMMGGPQASTAPGTAAVPMLQARRIEDSCTLPDYPAEVIRLDQPLSFVAQVIVGADGKVKRVAPAKASAYPEYDRAVLAALAQCRYIPALRGGTAIVAAMPFQLERAPGAKHP